VTDEEIVAFLGVILNMGMNLKPEIQDYFTEEWTQKCSFYKDVYTRVNVSRNTTPSRNISNENSSWGEGNSEKCEKECQSANFVCIYTVIIKITHFHKSCVV
jgi:hypothetical protein